MQNVVSDRSLHCDNVRMVVDSADLSHRLCLAVEQGLNSLVRLLLLSGASPHSENARGNTPLVIAARKGFNTAIIALIEADADPNCPDKVTTPLASAARYANADSIRLLLAAEADVNLRGPNGMAPLHAATQSKDTIACNLLMNAGALVNIPTTGRATQKIDLTPLHCAVRVGHPGIVRMLLDASADPNLVSGNRDQTALHAALDKELSIGLDGKYKDLEDIRQIINVLLSFGADTSLRSNKMTALEMARANNSSFVIKRVEGAAMDAAAKRAYSEQAEIADRVAAELLLEEAVSSASSRKLKSKKGKKKKYNESASASHHVVEAPGETENPVIAPPDIAHIVHGSSSTNVIVQDCIFDVSSAEHASFLKKDELTQQVGLARRDPEFLELTERLRCTRRRPEILESLDYPSLIALEEELFAVYSTVRERCVVLRAHASHDDECIVCLEAKREILFQPCGHLIVCTNCAAPLQECPKCRVAVEGQIRVFH